MSYKVYQQAPGVMKDDKISDKEQHFSVPTTLNVCFLNRVCVYDKSQYKSRHIQLWYNCHGVSNKTKANKTHRRGWIADQFEATRGESSRKWKERSSSHPGSHARAEYHQGA